MDENERERERERDVCVESRIGVALESKEFGD